MYFESATAAVEHATSQAKMKGFIVDENDLFTQIACGGRYNRLRPSVGNYHSFQIGLTKVGKKQSKCLSITIYGMASGKFELVDYIN